MTGWLNLSTNGRPQTRPQLSKDIKSKLNSYGVRAGEKVGEATAHEAGASIECIGNGG